MRRLALCLFWLLGFCGLLLLSRFTQMTKVENYVNAAAETHVPKQQTLAGRRASKRAADHVSRGSPANHVGSFFSSNSQNLSMEHKIHL